MVDAERYRELLRQGALAVDVRPEAVARQDPLPEAVSVPSDRIQAGTHGLPAGRPLVLLCSVGQMSKVAALYLEDEGLGPVYVLEGGLRSLEAGS
ncbi:rhodanese-like domain-containing protein [Oceanithermus sp.]